MTRSNLVGALDEADLRVLEGLCPGFGLGLAVVSSGRMAHSLARFPPVAWRGGRGCPIPLRPCAKVTGKRAGGHVWALFWALEVPLGVPGWSEPWPR
jgi:hypothetical protein